MKTVVMAGGSFSFLKSALLGLGAIGLGVLVGGGAVLVERRLAPQPVTLASLTPPDLTLPSLAAPEPQAEMVFTDVVWITPERSTAPKRRAAAFPRGARAQVAAPAVDEDRSWCGKSCLSDLEAPERIERRLAREAAAQDSAGAPPMVVQASLSKYVRAHLDEVKACWTSHGLAVDPGLAGHLTLVLRVGGEGRVEQAAVAGSTLGVPAVERCIERRAATWRFPRLEGATTVRYPLSLSVFGAKGE